MPIAMTPKSLKEAKRDLNKKIKMQKNWNEG